MILCTIVNLTPSLQTGSLVNLAIVLFPHSVKPCTYMELCFLSSTRRLKEKSERECWYLTIDTGIPGLTCTPPIAAVDDVHHVHRYCWEQWPGMKNAREHASSEHTEYSITLLCNVINRLHSVKTI